MSKISRIHSTLQMLVKGIGLCEALIRVSSTIHVNSCQKVFLCLSFECGLFNFSKIFHFRKAIKAALFLLPLLGITNFVVMIESPTEPISFAIWSYTSHFLVSFQGFLISLLYCFLNGEVSECHCFKSNFCKGKQVKDDALMYLYD